MAIEFPSALFQRAVHAQVNEAHESEPFPVPSGFAGHIYVRTNLGDRQAIFAGQGKRDGAEIEEASPSRIRSK